MKVLESIIKVFFYGGMSFIPQPYKWYKYFEMSCILSISMFWIGLVNINFIFNVLIIRILVGTKDIIIFNSFIITYNLCVSYNKIHIYLSKIENANVSAFLKLIIDIFIYI